MYNNNLCVIILLVVIVIGVIWFINNSVYFMRIRPVESPSGAEDEDSQMICCKFTAYPNTMYRTRYEWMPDDECKNLIKQGGTWDREFGVNTKNQCLALNN